MLWRQWKIRSRSLSGASSMELVNYHMLYANYSYCRAPRVAPEVASHDQWCITGLTGCWMTKTRLLCLSYPRTVDISNSLNNSERCHIRSIIRRYFLHLVTHHVCVLSLPVTGLHVWGEKNGLFIYLSITTPPLLPLATGLIREDTDSIHKCHVASSYITSCASSVYIAKQLGL